jgi:hypothetical protein
MRSVYSRTQLFFKSAFLTWVAIGFPIFVFCVVAWRYCTDIPWFDDFDPYPISLSIWLEADTWWEKMTEVLRPNNEHRMIFGKLSMLFYYFFTGQINFRFLQGVGICFTLGTLFLIFKAFQTSKLPLWYFVPVAFFLFQFEHYLVYGWAICGLQHAPVLFFVTLTTFLLARNQFYWAVAAAICANFSMSNGNLVWFVGIGLLLLQHQYKKLGIWLLVGVCSIYLYLSGMTTLNNESSIPFIIAHPAQTLFGFFAFLGGIFDLIPNRSLTFRTTPPIIWGGIAVGITFVWWFKIIKNWFSEKFKSAKSVQLSEFSLFITGLSIFLIANAVIIAFLRPRFGFFVMVVSNYKLYPALFLCVTYFLVLLLLNNPKRQPYAFRGFLVVSIGIWVMTFIHSINIFSERRKYLIISTYNQKYNGFGLGLSPDSPQAQYVNSVMEGLEKKEIYTYPHSFERIINAIKTQSNTQTKLLPKIKRDKDINIQIDDYPYPSGINDGVYVFFKSAAQLYIFKMNSLPNTGRNVLKTYVPGVELTLTSGEYRLLPGKYTMGFVEAKDDNVRAERYQEITITK